MTADRSALRARLSEFLPSTDVASAVALARPTARLFATDASGGGRSRLGGQPLLPPGVPWPRWDDIPLSFLAQVDLADVAPLVPDEPLPGSGLLTVFYAREQLPAGLPHETGGWYVEVVDAENVTEVRAPHGAVVSPYVPVQAARGWTLPDLAEDLVVPANDDAWSQALEALDVTPSHRVGGWPRIVQSSVFEACAESGDSERVERWRLLLQLDSDEHQLGWMWGDVGIVYFCVHEDDARCGAWDRARLQLQCY